MSDFVRAIGLGRATALVVGTIIGASIFVQPSLVSGAVPSSTGILIVWAASGALTLIGALITAELSSAFPETGGVYVFLRRAYSPLVAYLWGWAMFWVMHTGIIAVIATVAARYIGQLVPLSDVGQRWTAVACVLVLSAVNYVGVRYGSALQAFFTVVKVAAVLMIVILGAWYLITRGIPESPPAARPATFGTFVDAMVAGLFAYGGWHMVTYAAGETRDPERTIPRALTLGTLIVTVAYIAVNASYLAAMSVDRVAASSHVAADFATTVMGSGAATIVAALVVLSALGGMTGIILSGPRVYLAMAQDGLLFRWFDVLHPVYRTPHRAIALQGVWASILVLTGTYRALFTRVVYTEWVFFALMAASLLVLRRRASYAPAYRVPWHPLLPVVFVAASAIIVIHQVGARPRESIAGLAIVAVGIPVYWLWTRTRSPSTHDHRRP